MPRELSPDEERAIEEAYADGTIFSPANRDPVPARSPILEAEIRVILPQGAQLADQIIPLLGERVVVALRDATIEEVRIHADRYAPEKSYQLFRFRAPEIQITKEQG